MALYRKQRGVEREDLCPFKMSAKYGTCKLNVLIAAGLNKVPMLADGLRIGLGRRVVGTDVPVDVGVKLLDKLENERIPGSLIKGEMELEIKI